MITRMATPMMEHPIEPQLGINVIAMENPSAYFDLVQSISSSEEKWLFFSDKKRVIASKVCIFLGDPASGIDVNSLFKKAMISQLIAFLQDEQYKELHEITEQLYQFMVDLVMSNEMDIELDNEFDPKLLLDLFHPRLVQSDDSSAFELLQDIIRIAGALQIEQTLVLLHVFDYCTKEQIEYLQRDTLRQELQVLCLERSNQPLEFEKGRNWYLDADWAELY